MSHAVSCSLRPDPCLLLLFLLESRRLPALLLPWSCLERPAGNQGRDAGPRWMERLYSESASIGGGEIVPGGSDSVASSSNIRVMAASLSTPNTTKGLRDTNKTAQEPATVSGRRRSKPWQSLPS